VYLAAIVQIECLRSGPLGDAGDADAMMRPLQIRIAKLLVAALVTICVGLQVLEATGRWDRSFQDASDEAIIVTVALCIGVALAAAGASRPRTRLVAVQLPIAPAGTTLSSQTSRCIPLAFCSSPPLSLRI
jgi:hypothetical protein